MQTGKKRRGRVIPRREQGQFRIIGGDWRRRRLDFPAHPGVRPTGDRVRETLFNWLAPVVSDSSCLDLFAGSGALGFEALSRGAAEVTFVERDRKAASALQDNAKQLGAEIRVANEAAARYLAHSQQRFDVIFFDPPFADRRAQALLDDLLASHLTADGLLYLECPKRSELPYPGRQFKHATAGDCQFALLHAGPVSGG